jgi:hypothetical protein
MGLKWSSAKRGRGKNQNGEDHFSQTQEILVEGLATDSLNQSQRRHQMEKLLPCSAEELQWVSKE